MISRFIFIVGGYAIHVYLARRLGPEEYGIFGVCTAIITICYVFLNNGVPQIVSKSSAIYPQSTKHFLNKGLIVQFTIAGTLGLLLVIFAKHIAVVFNNKAFITPLYISGLIVITQSQKFVYRGALNGLKQFGRENAVLSTYSSVRIFAAIFLVYLGFGVTGALTGFLTASISSALLGFVLTWNLDNTRYNSMKFFTLLKSSIPIMMLFSFITIIMNLDLLSVRYYMSEGQFSGYYTSAATLSKLTYWIFFAFCSVLLPYVSSSFSNDDITQTRKHINAIIRYSLMVVLPMTVLISLYADNAVCLIYGAGYHPAGDVLSILVYGLSSLGLISIFATIMIGINEVRVMTVYALIGTVIAIFLNILLVPRIGMMGGAIATTISATVVAIIVYGFIKRRLEMEINIPGVLRVTGSAALVILIGHGISGLEVNFIIKAASLYLGYCFFLILFREINNDDMNFAKQFILKFSARGNT